MKIRVIKLYKHREWRWNLYNTYSIRFLKNCVIIYWDMVLQQWWHCYTLFYFFRVRHFSNKKKPTRYYTAQHIFLLLACPPHSRIANCSRFNKFWFHYQVVIIKWLLHKWSCGMFLRRGKRNIFFVGGRYDYCWRLWYTAHSHPIWFL